MSDPAFRATVVEKVPLSDRAGLSMSEASIYTSLSVPTLKKHRCSGTDPRYARIGSKIVYTPSDLEAWLAQHLIGRSRR